MTESFECVCADEVTGKIIAVIRGPLSAFGGFVPPDGQIVVAGNADPKMQYVDLNTLTIVDRPEPNIPATKTLAVDEVWSISSIAEGTEVVVDGVSHGLVDDTGLELEFPMIGEWVVELNSPWPYMNKRCDVTVEV